MVSLNGKIFNMTSVLIFCLIDGRVILDRDKAGPFNVFNNKSISANKEQQLLAILPCTLFGVSECSCVNCLSLILIYKNH